MKNQKGNTAVLLIVLISILLVSIGVIIGDTGGRNSAFDRCVKYYETMSVVEANKLCSAIIKGEKK